jgi:invasion protein IalB
LDRESDHDRSDSASTCTLLDLEAAAQWATKPPSSAAGGTSTEPTPDHTTATFGDWTLRCDRRPDLSPPQRVCELGLAIQKAGETGVQAQMAIGRVAAGQPLRITAVLPPNVALRTNPRVVVEGLQLAPTLLSWTRCVAGACFADAEVSAELLKELRSRTEPSRLDYRDGTEREVVHSESFRGVRSALDALALEEAR